MGEFERLTSMLCSPKDPFRNDRRKKLLWTEEEQEMLQVQVCGLDSLIFHLYRL